MQVLFSSDASVAAPQAMAQHVEKVVKDALGRFGEQVTRVEAHLTDNNGHQRSHSGLWRAFATTTGRLWA